MDIIYDFFIHFAVNCVQSFKQLFLKIYKGEFFMKKLITIMALALCSVVSAHPHCGPCTTHSLPDNKCATNAATFVTGSYNLNPINYATNVQVDRCGNTAQVCYVPKGACMTECNQPVNSCAMEA